MLLERNRRAERKSVECFRWRKYDVCHPVTAIQFIYVVLFSVLSSPTFPVTHWSLFRSLQPVVSNVIPNTSVSGGVVVEAAISFGGFVVQQKWKIIKSTQKHVKILIILLNVLRIKAGMSRHHPHPSDEDDPRILNPRQIVFVNLYQEQGIAYIRLSFIVNWTKRNSFSHHWSAAAIWDEPVHLYYWCFRKVARLFLIHVYDVPSSYKPRHHECRNLKAPSIFHFLLCDYLRISSKGFEQSL